LLKFLEKNKIKLVFIPLIIYWIALFIGTSIPIESVPSIFEFHDKLEHTTAYFGLSVLLNLSIIFQEKYPKMKSKHNLVTLGAVVVYGIADELHQMLIPGRSCEILDFVSDLLGILLGILTVYVVMKFENYRLEKIQPELY
jgi:VanZ family protein